MMGNEPRSQRVVVFTPINAAGHMQSSLAIADKLRADYNYKCIFLIAGPPYANIIEDHNHGLIVVEDAYPLWDYQIESDDDTDAPFDEAREKRKEQLGKKKRKFEGALRWPQITAHCKHLFQDSARSHIGMAKLVQDLVVWSMNTNDAIDRQIERIKPDLIVADSVVIAPSILRHQETKPFVRIFSPNPICVPKSKLANGVRPPPYQGKALYSRQERARMQAEDPKSWQSILDEWREASERYAKLIEGIRSKVDEYYLAHGFTSGTGTVLGPISHQSLWLNIYMYPEALDYDQEDDLFEYPPRWLRCDSLVRNTDGRNEKVQHEVWAKLLAERKDKFKFVVYLSLGSVACGSPDLMKRLISYLEGDTETLYIVSKGVNGGMIELNSRNMLGANYLPQTFLLQRSDLAIIHGGNNSLTESLYYGKPVIILPAFGDQLDNAQRVEDLRLGRRLNLYKCTKQQFLSAIKDVLTNRNLIEKVRAIGERMRSRDELGKVTSVLRDLVEENVGLKGNN